MRRHGSSSKATDTLASPNGTRGSLPWWTIDELVAQPLVVSFTMVMRPEVGQRLPQMTFTERDHAIEAFFFDRAYESLQCVGDAWLAVRVSGLGF